jgi:D-amino peptidase
VRVLISADAEGVTGITNTNELLFGRPHYEFMRIMMTDDVNAAIEGAFAAAPPRWWSTTRTGP